MSFTNMLFKTLRKCFPCLTNVYFAISSIKDTVNNTLVDAHVIHVSLYNAMATSHMDHATYLVLHVRHAQTCDQNADRGEQQGDQGIDETAHR